MRIIETHLDTRPQVGHKLLRLEKHRGLDKARKINPAPRRRLATGDRHCGDRDPSTVC